jgi:hypothetical protein
MDWKQQSAALADLAVGTFGEDVTFSPKAGGGSHTVTAVFDEDFQSVDPDAGVPVTSRRPNLGVVLANLPVPPQKGDTWTVRGIEYRCTEVQPDSEGHAAILLHVK